MMNRQHHTVISSQAKTDRLRKVQRLSRKGVEPSGSKREASLPKDEDIVCSALKDAEGRKLRCRSQHTGLMDNTNNSLVDVLKHTLEGQMKLIELPSPGNGDQATVLSWGGATFFETTLLTTTPNYKGSGSTAIRTYMSGRDGVISVKLSRDDRTDIAEGDYRNLKLWRGKYALGQSFDPAGLIGGGTSYNIVGTWGLPPDTTMRCRCFDFVPQTT